MQGRCSLPLLIVLANDRHTLVTPLPSQTFLGHRWQLQQQERAQKTASRQYS